MPREINEASEECVKCCCECCCGIFTTIIGIILILCNTLTKPNYSMQLFDVSALNKTSNFTTQSNHSFILYDLQVNVNGKVERGIYFDALEVAFYYKPNVSSGPPMWTVTEPPFYMERDEGSHIVGNIDTSEVNWEKPRADVVVNGTAVFRVKVNASVSYKINMVGWKIKRRHVVMGADLPVNDQGSLVLTKKQKKRGGVKLTSGARNRIANAFLHVIPTLAVLGLC